LYFANTTGQLWSNLKVYDNPGPYAKLLERASTFEEHLQQIYFNQGFAYEQRDGEEWLVKQ